MKIPYLLISFILLITHCVKSRNKSDSLPLEQSYHEKMLNIKGDSLYFIPKNEVGWYFDLENILPVDSSKKGDAILFYDAAKNINYQCVCVGNSDSIITIKCLNLASYKYYTTTLSKDSISDIDTFSKDMIRAYTRK